MLQKVSDRVAYAIQKSPFSDSQIASDVGISSTTVWRWRNKKKETDNFPARDLKALAQKLRISYEWLQFGNGSKTDDSKINEIEHRVVEAGVNYKGLDQTLSNVESKAKSLKQDLQSLIDDIEKIHSGSRQ